MKTLFFACCKRWLRYPYVRICLLLMTAGGILLAVLGAEVYRAKTASLDDAMLSVAFFCEVMLTVPVITALTHQERTDGVIRSKLVCGYSRTAVLLSQLLTAFTFSAVCSLLLFAPLFVRAFDLLGRAMSAQTVSMLLVFLLALPVLSAVCTAVCLNTDGFSGIAVCIALLLGLFAADIGVRQILSRPQMIVSEFAQVDGTVQEQTQPNPEYVGGTKRKLLQIADRANPFSCWLTAKEYADVLPVLSGRGTVPDADRTEYAEQIRHEITGAECYLTGFAVLVSGIGLAVFRRRDLQ